MSERECPFDDPESHRWEQRRAVASGGSATESALVESRGAVASVGSATESALVESRDLLRSTLNHIFFTPTLRRVPSGSLFAELPYIVARMDRYYDDLLNYGVNSTEDLGRMVAFANSNAGALPGQIGLLDEDKEILLEWYPEEEDEEDEEDEEEEEEEEEDESVPVKTIVEEMGELLFDIREKISDGEYLQLMNGLQKISNIVNQ
jgi:hypothetical protein